MFDSIIKILETIKEILGMIFAFIFGILDIFGLKKADNSIDGTNNTRNIRKIIVIFFLLFIIIFSIAYCCFDIKYYLNNLFNAIQLRITEQSTNDQDYAYHGHINDIDNNSENTIEKQMSFDIETKINNEYYYYIHKRFCKPRENCDNELNILEKNLCAGILQKHIDGYTGCIKYKSLKAFKNLDEIDLISGCPIIHRFIDKDYKKKPILGICFFAAKIGIKTRILIFLGSDKDAMESYMDQKFVNIATHSFSIKKSYISH